MRSGRLPNDLPSTRGRHWGEPESSIRITDFSAQGRCGTGSPAAGVSTDVVVNPAPDCVELQVDGFAADATYTLAVVGIRDVSAVRNAADGSARVTLGESQVVVSLPSALSRKNRRYSQHVARSRG